VAQHPQRGPQGDETAQRAAGHQGIHESYDLHLNPFNLSTVLLFQGDLYGLFACMVTGRPWETVMQGLTKVKYSKEEVGSFNRKDLSSY